MDLHQIKRLAPDLDPHQCD
jgi:hypothetical protein